MADDVVADMATVEVLLMMAAHIRQHDVSLIDDPDVSDAEFDARSTEFGYQQSRSC